MTPISRRPRNLILHRVWDQPIRRKNFQGTGPDPPPPTPAALGTVT